MISRDHMQSLIPSFSFINYQNRNGKQGEWDGEIKKEAERARKKTKFMSDKASVYVSTEEILMNPILFPLNNLFTSSKLLSSSSSSREVREIYWDKFIMM